MNEFGDAGRTRRHEKPAATGVADVCTRYPALSSASRSSR